MTGYPDIPKKRNGTADLMKGIAVLFMIQVHIMEQLADQGLYNSILGKISLFLGGPACAPVFMAIMGYFLASSNKKLKGFITRGLLLFTGGILLNTGRSANLLFRIFQGASDLNPWHFVFGADILTLAGLSILVIGFLRLVFKARYLPYLVTGFMVVAISHFVTPGAASTGIRAYLNAFLWGGPPWSYFPLFPWLAYILVGYAFRLFRNHANFLNKFVPREHFYFAIPLAAGLILTLPWASGITSDLSGPGGYYHHDILFFLWTLTFMLTYLVAISLVDLEYGEHKLALAVKWVGTQVTAIYIIQWLIIGNMAAILYRSQHLFQVAAWFPAVTLVACFIWLLYLRIMTLRRR